MNKINNIIGKWLAYTALDFIFIIEVMSLGLGARDLVYWLILIPGSWGLVWTVNKLDNEHNKR